MSDSYNPLQVVVWGDFACFSRPELKAERVSYPMMTPSAARGALEAIFWKPEFRWAVRQIHVLRPRSGVDTWGASFYRHFSIMRNEIGKRATGDPISLSDDGVRQQRHTLALRDVAYLIRADVIVRPNVAEDPAKYRDQFQRRVKKGQCFHRPYLGCREFAADFAPPMGDEDQRRFRHSEPIDLGLMLFDIIHSADGDSTPIFFPARLEDGILNVSPRPKTGSVFPCVLRRPNTEVIFGRRLTPHCTRSSGLVRMETTGSQTSMSILRPGFNPVFGTGED